MLVRWYHMVCIALLFTVAPRAALANKQEASSAAIGADPNALIGPAAAFITILPPKGRYVLVDASTARLFMIEDGKVADAMRVIVGKPASATPVMKSMLHSATFNPYWNVPTDLAQNLIAPRVLRQGLSYLRKNRYIVVSAFSSDAVDAPAESVDWKKVAAGSEKAFVRQLPGGSNAMGQIKLGLAGSDGIFLHDTPDKHLFEASDRRISNGCVRLEDAERLARWLFGADPSPPSGAPEQIVPLPHEVPIIITYSASANLEGE